MRVWERERERVRVTKRRQFASFCIHALSVVVCKLMHINSTAPWCVHTLRTYPFLCCLAYSSLSCYSQYQPTSLSASSSLSALRVVLLFRATSSLPSRTAQTRTSLPLRSAPALVDVYCICWLCIQRTLLTLTLTLTQPHSSPFFSLPAATTGLRTSAPGGHQQRDRLRPEAGGRTQGGYRWEEEEEGGEASGVTTRQGEASWLLLRVCLAGGAVHLGGSVSVCVSIKLSDDLDCTYDTCFIIDMYFTYAFTNLPDEHYNIVLLV